MGPNFVFSFENQSERYEEKPNSIFDQLQKLHAPSLKPQRNKKGQNLLEMPTKNDVFFSAASCKKGIIFVGHVKQI